MLVSSEDQQAKKKKKSYRIWGGTRSSLGVKTILRIGFWGQPAWSPQLGQRKLDLSSHQGKTQRSPELEVMMGQLFYCFTEALACSNLLPQTNAKPGLKWVILALLSHWPMQHIYSTLNIKTYLFCPLTHKLFPLPSGPIPQNGVHYESWNFRKFLISIWRSHSTVWKTTEV